MRLLSSKYMRRLVEISTVASRQNYRVRQKRCSVAKDVFTSTEQPWLHNVTSASNAPRNIRPSPPCRIIGKLEEGRCVTAEFGIAHSIVSRLWRQFQTTGTAIRRFSSGRPRGTTPADDRYIVLQARRNRRQTAGEIARHTTQATGQPISRFTVARRLHGGDDSRFSLSSDSHRILIWRERESRNHPSNIIERERYGGCGVLVWGGIMLGSRTDLHIFDAGSVNGTRYCNEILLPYVRLFRGVMGLQFLFMDDNAPCHRTVAAEQLLEKGDIERIDWPARSRISIPSSMQLAPTLISKLTGKFLRITIQSDGKYRKLAQFLRHEGVEYKSFMLKSNRPVKLLIRGLPTSTKVEEIRVEIEREGFRIHKISRLQNFKTKAAMPLIYLQLANDAKADTIFQFTEMFAHKFPLSAMIIVSIKRHDQCWRCQGFFQSSEVCHLPIKCLKCAGPHEAKNRNRAFEDPLICTNCGGEHAANWRQCPRFPKTKNNKKAPQKGNQNKNQHPKGNNPNNLPQNKIQERNLGSRNDLNLKSSIHTQSKIQQPQSNYRAVIPSVSYSKVVSGQIREISHVNTPHSNFSIIFTNVIQIANDEGVDEELLARAFRAALPALRKLSHPDDKACEIFQAYVTLKNDRKYVAHNSA
ncbi:transposable element Tcb2 transposase [Trichonephila clavipes]|nr:transposable element Tcb2 transposase [Trichonephila clavipes]